MLDVSLTSHSMIFIDLYIYTYIIVCYLNVDVYCWYIHYFHTFVTILRLLLILFSFLDWLIPIQLYEIRLNTCMCTLNFWTLLVLVCLLDIICTCTDYWLNFWYIYSVPFSGSINNECLLKHLWCIHLVPPQVQFLYM